MTSLTQRLSGDWHSWPRAAKLRLLDRLGGPPAQRSVIIGSSSESVAEKRSLALRTMAQTAEWQATFPGVERARGMKWDSVEWSLAPNGLSTPGRLHPTIAADGTGGGGRGRRAGAG